MLGKQEQFMMISTPRKYLYNLFVNQLYNDN